MKILTILAISVAIPASLLAADQYHVSWQDKKMKEFDWIQNCVPAGPGVIIPSIGLFNHIHSFDLKTCTWSPTEHGTPGLLESIYTSFIEPVFSYTADGLEIRYAHAICIAPSSVPPRLRRGCFYMRSNCLSTNC